MREQQQKPTTQPRTFRLDSGTWGKLKARAASEGVSASQAVQLLAEGYARGVYDLPALTWPDEPTTF